MRIWRLTQAQFAPGLDGKGSQLFGGRWNSPGIPVVYTSSSLALAALEMFVTLPAEIRAKIRMPPLIAVCLEVPDHLIHPLDVASLPESYGIADCRLAGEGWSVGQRSLGLMVPSQVIRREMNILLNPAHPDMPHVQVAVSEPFFFDDRLV